MRDRGKLEWVERSVPGMARKCTLCLDSIAKDWTECWWGHAGGEGTGQYLLETVALPQQRAGLTPALPWASSQLASPYLVCRIPFPQPLLSSLTSSHHPSFSFLSLLCQVADSLPTVSLLCWDHPWSISSCFPCGFPGFSPVLNVVQQGRQLDISMHTFLF